MTSDLGGLSELRQTLQAICASDMPSLADVRRIVNLRHRSARPDDPAFFAFRAAASELDTVPENAVRHRFHEAMLAREDRKCETYMRAASDELRRSAATLLSCDWLGASSGR